MDTLKARRILGGLSVSDLAKQANVSDQTIIRLENGGNCLAPEAQRILDALFAAVALTSNTQASPTVFTSATHKFQTGDTVVIAGVATADADPNGTRVVTRVSPTTFSVPVNCSVAGGTGGTATPTSASVGQTSL